MAPVVPRIDSVDALLAEDVDVRFGGLQALGHVTLEVKPSGITGLVGPNGAGKTTLFGVLSGFLRPASGRVLLGDREITGLPPHKRARLGIARTFQQSELFPSLTVAEHLLLGYRMGRTPGRVVSDLISLRGWLRGTSDEMDRVDQVLTLLGLSHLAHTACAGLPTGITRRVDVGRAIAGGPRYLLLDEPAAGLDLNETKDLSRALRQAVEREGIGILLVEHDFELVMNLSEFVYVLDHGSLIASGSPAEIRRSDTVMSAYLGKRP